MLKLAYIHIIEARVFGSVDVKSAESMDFLIDIWGKTSPVLVGSGFKALSAKKAVEEEFKDKDVGIAFRRYFISNPDLVFRIKEGIEFTLYDRKKFYNVMEEDGYTTWEFSKEFKAAQNSKLQKFFRDLESWECSVHL
jgi:NADPH2 dehydrogenase